AFQNKEELKITYLGMQLSGWIPNQHPVIISGWLDGVGLSPFRGPVRRWLIPILYLHLWRDGT
ncbi:hypothetical protein A2U01_0001621, partial [Trifolium medium]|nr:hypothetical protein [Trifolium medium]